MTSSSNLGPIFKYNHAKKYLDDNNIPKLFECLIASLMIERPDNLYNYLDKQINEIKEIGLDKVEWDTFIRDSHPTKNPVRVELIQDEVSIKIKQEQEAAAKGDEAYKPEVFELTEPQDEEQT